MAYSQEVKVPLGSKMENLFRQTSVLLQQSQMGLERLEQSISEQHSQPILNEVYGFMSQISENCAEIDRLVSKEPVGRKKELRYRADQFKYDYGCMYASLNALNTRLNDRWRVAREREQLLHQRFRPNETSVNLGDPEAVIGERVVQSNRLLDDLLAQGTAVLDQLRWQGADLGFIKRKIIDVGRQLGVSNSMLEVVERRVNGDWVAFSIGCICVVILMYCFYKYWSSRS